MTSRKCAHRAYVPRPPDPAPTGAGGPPRIRARRRCLFGATASRSPSATRYFTRNCRACMRTRDQYLLWTTELPRTHAHKRHIPALAITCTTHTSCPLLREPARATPLNQSTFTFDTDTPSSQSYRENDRLASSDWRRCVGRTPAPCSRTWRCSIVRSLVATSL